MEGSYGCILGGNVQSTDKGLPSTVSDGGTVKTTLLPKGPHGDKDSEGFKPPADMKPLTTPIADLSRTDTNDEDDVLEAGKEMDKDIPPTNEEA
ncbi:hypothetical protein Tco_0014906 [Tanacetum coccineum]